MLSRAKRAEIINPSGTLDLGPGAYETAPSRAEQKFAMAPFGSTTMRDTAMGDGTNPGPGAYLSIESERVKDKNRPSAMFVSKAIRIEADKERLKAFNTPGPGAYEPDVRSKPLQQRAPPQQQGRSMHAAQGINWVQVATAPSIPGAQQSYGYEEGVTGALIQQAAPHKGFTGRGTDGAGPGDYDPDIKLAKPRAPQIDFARSAGKRADVVSKDAMNQPGPGAYRPENVGNSSALHGGIMHQRQMSSFASASKRINPAMQASIAPGPGAYKTPSSFKSQKEFLAAHPDTFHVFGASQPSKDNHVHVDNAPQPGPGSYELPQSVKLKDKDKRSAAFASAGPRFHRDTSSNAEAPGPGMYNPDTTLVTNLKKKPKGRFGGFGSTSTRFDLQQEKASNGPGPMSYTLPPPNVNPAENRRKDQRGAAFRSNSKRSDLANPNGRTNGSEESPAFYDPPRDWPKPTTTATSFISSVPRFHEKKTMDVPGPGNYNLERPLKGGPRFPQARRLDSQTQDDGPGPGSYNTVPGMQKKTFNISIGGLQ